MDRLNTILEQLRAKINSYFSKDATGHNTDHLERTLNYALYLQSKEGGDKIVVAVSALIHDVHRIMSGVQGRFVSPKESLPVVAEFLNDLELTDEQKQHILNAVEHHEEYSFNNKGVTVTDIESKILQDADNLDAIGAIGLVRVLRFGQTNNRVEYDPSVPLYQREFEEGMHEASTIHHIYNKMLRLGDHMNTKTARKLAKKKTKLMAQFVDMYIQEFNGEF